MRLKNFLTVLLVSVLSTAVLSQHKLTVKADQAFEKGYWNAAIENYRLALKKEKDSEIKLRIIYNLAQSYSGAKDYKNSAAICFCEKYNFIFCMNSCWNKKMVKPNYCC